MGKTKVVIDTNVLVSALKSDSYPRDILRKVIADEIELVCSEKGIKELMRVLNYPRLKLNKEEKERFINIIMNISRLIEIKNKINIIKDDPSDNIFLETAIEGGARYIISGDHHLLRLKEFEGIKIIKPAEFMKHHD